MTAVAPRSLDRSLMRAAVYRRFGDPDVIRVEDVPKPSARKDEVLIRVLASTVSAADYRARTRDVPRGLRLPASLTLGFRRPRVPILGMDVAGVVEAVGPAVTRFRVGDEVIAMLGAAYGGHAEYALIRQTGAVTAKPRTMDFDEAVTLVFGGITARAFLNQVPLPRAARVLINGASGAVGSAAVQLAREAGAHITAVCSGGNRDLVISLGADEVIDYADRDFATSTGTPEYDVIMDCVGNAPFERVAHLVRPGGALLLVVTDLAGAITAAARSRWSGKRVITGPGAYAADDLAYLARLADAGRYRAVVDSTYELEQIAEAHRYVATGRKKGSLVVRIASAGDRVLRP